MIPFEQAAAIVRQSARLLGAERSPLAACLHRVLAADVAADADMPPFDKSAMDGFACRRVDLPGPLRVGETIAAGATAAAAVEAGWCARIMTGAPMPAGADFVVKFEDTETLADGSVRCLTAETAGNICKQGEDLRRGDIVVPRGTWLQPQHLALLASVGCAQVPVARRPRVGVIPTGDELVDASVAPAAGQIRNSNGPQLAAQVLAAGAEPVNFGTVGDDATELTRVLREALAACDVVVLSGGVSTGDFDLVPDAMQAAGLQILFDSVAVKPGRPTTFAVAPGAWCFGLPGNPVSTFVQFEFLVKPLLRDLMGCCAEPLVIAARLAAAVSRRQADRQVWLPVELTADGDARPLEYHGSAHVHALGRAHGFIVVPVGTTHLEEGTQVRVRPISTTH